MILIYLRYNSVQRQGMPKVIFTSNSKCLLRIFLQEWTVGAEIVTAWVTCVPECQVQVLTPASDPASCRGASWEATRDD